jgi:hypothetical protein
MGRALDVYERQYNYTKIFNTKLDGVRRIGRPKCDGKMVLIKILEY